MATIADRSRTKEIIERLQMIMDTAPSVPLTTGKVSVYKDEVQSLLSELSSQMEMEIKTYHEVNDRKGKIISRNVEFVPFDIPKGKLKGYYFDYSRVYWNKPEGYTFQRERTWQINNLKPREYK